MPKRPTLTKLCGMADRRCQKWFWEDSICVAADWGEWDKWGNPECWCRWGHPEWAHIIRRKDKGIRHDPRNAITLCSTHHELLDQKHLMQKFIEDRYPGRYDLLLDLVRDRHIAGYPDLRPIYEGWIAWYTDRMDNFKTWDGEL